MLQSPDGHGSNDGAVAERLQALLGKLQDSAARVQSTLLEPGERELTLIRLRSAGGEEVLEPMSGPVSVAEIISRVASSAKGSSTCAGVNPKILHGVRELRHSELVGSDGWPLETTLIVVWPLLKEDDDASFLALEREWTLRAPALENEMALVRMEEACAAREAQIAKSEGSPLVMLRRRQQMEASRRLQLLAAELCALRERFSQAKLDAGKLEESQHQRDADLRACATE
eukprot:TRINITY_DN83761_c0_g1_i1.p1 TRINITY_DN83761_c0_g1~~TRINITY_DN83761_c0_g1_i1.p1  ORF type:complete len:230 (+),score=62.39 TRINITY_DN83761_c0_g1_i1:80-769(+)